MRLSEMIFIFGKIRLTIKVVAELIVEYVGFVFERDIRNLSPAGYLVKLFVGQKFIFESFVVEFVFSHLQSAFQNFGSSSI